eukprot:39170-Chlamydomonas_euryale.AAC.12
MVTGRGSALIWTPWGRSAERHAHTQGPSREPRSVWLWTCGRPRGYPQQGGHTQQGRPMT